MTPLTQQLEDKKKELELLSKSISRNNIEYIRRLNSEIAILEQAIDEIKSKDEEITQLKEKKWTEHTITPLYDFEFHNIDCMTDNNGNINFFGYYNNDLNHPDYRPSSSIKLKELDAEFLYRLFTKTQQAEMQKQRQEILEWVNYLERQIISSGEKVYTEWLRQELSIKKQQLNQPKTEE